MWNVIRIRHSVESVGSVGISGDIDRESHSHSLVVVWFSLGSLLSRSEVFFLPFEGSNGGSVGGGRGGRESDQPQPPGPAPKTSGRAPHTEILLFDAFPRGGE